MNLHVEVKGAGPALLMCNGLGQSVEAWGRFGELLAEDYTLIVFDAPGVGRSPAVKCPYAMRDLASRVVAQVLARGFSRVHVLGYSFGGMLAQQIASQFPNLVDRLVLVSTLDAVTGLVVRDHAVSLLRSPRRYLEPLVSEIARPILAGDQNGMVGRAPSMLGLVHQIGAAASWFGVDRIMHRTLVVGGTDDVVTPVHNVESIVGRCDSGVQVIVEGAGHLWVLDQPVESAALVKGFLSTGYETMEGVA